MYNACRCLAILNGCSPETVLLIYHGDEKFTNQPDHISFGITHRVSIYDDFVRHFSDPSDIMSAFETDLASQQKIDKLRANQDAGLDQLQCDNSYVFQMSDMQGEYFKQAGIPQTRVLPFPPPMHAMFATHESEQIPPTYVPGVDRKFFLFTAVARLTLLKMRSCWLMRRSFCLSVGLICCSLLRVVMRLLFMLRLVRSHLLGYRYKFRIA